uniref:tRNA wybutosine-synthesizing protein 5 n=1 Tax=Aceria tosichella TaxID=561515 RepID=A0A6G1SEJ2_9ACAR
MADLDCKRVKNCSRVDEQDFKRIVGMAEPVVLKNCDFGDCMTKWNIDYLNEKLAGLDIVMQQTNYPDPELPDEHSEYKTCKFEDFSKDLMHKRGVYYSLIHRDPKAKKPIRIVDDFPAIGDDLKPPSFIPYGKDNALFHSSVLRIASADLQEILRFDHYETVLCQVSGLKRVILFPPKDSRHLYAHGNKSKLNNFGHACAEFRPQLYDTEPRLCFLYPGDCLFIPKCWWYGVRSIVSESQDPDFGDGKKPKENDPMLEWSIGFSIFWRAPELATHSLYEDDDVCGNKLLKPYELALSNLNRALRHLEQIPEEYQEIYKLMLWKRVNEKLCVGEVAEDDY